MKPAIIRCSKCGYQSNIISDTCLKCGSPLVKICGNCEAVNAVEKNYCDGCGSLLALKMPEQKESSKEEKKEEKPSSPKPVIEFESLHETVQGHADSFRKKQEANPQNTAPKIENKDERVEAAKKEKEKLEELKNKKTEEKKSSVKVQDKKISFAKYAVFIAVALAVFSIAWLAVSPSIPKIKLVITAKNYLNALKEKNYSQAYSYLSNNSKFTCSFTDYVKYNDAYYSSLKNGWEFKDVSVFKMENEAALVKYSLKEGTGPWREDYISFVKEHDKWVRPYIWHLFSPIDEAISKGDFSQALFLAQKLYLTDPIDPRTSGYLCNTEYLMGLYDKASESCKRVLESQADYPVGFNKEEIFWFTFYYADSLRFMARFKEALDIYEELFSFEDISLKNKCPLLMSRADAYVRLGDFDKASVDAASAVSVCPEGINKKEALKRSSFLNSDLSSEAVSMVQKAKPSQDSQSIFEQRNSVLKSLNSDKGKKDSYKDEWIAQKEEGPIYTVKVIQQKVDKKGKKTEENEVYRASVNLWTGSVKTISR
ncbi:MAG: zinc ribbon domain-containing protein [Elusimicrobiota bacterium]